MNTPNVGDTIKLRSGVFSARNSYDKYGREIIIDAIVTKVLGTEPDDGENGMYEVTLGLSSELPFVILHSDIV